MGDEKRSPPAHAQHLILEGRHTLSVSGVDEVMTFDESSVVMNTPLGQLHVQGEELRVENLAVESGELTVKGKIGALTFTEPVSPWWERLFGR